MAQGSIAAGSLLNLDEYCRSLYGPNAIQSVSRLDNGLLCTIQTDDGLGLTHYKFEAADACLAEFGSADYRREAELVLCVESGNTSGAMQSSQVNLEEICASNFGVNASLTQNTLTGEPMCTVQTDGGLGLLHHKVDTATLCPSGLFPGAVAGGMLTCGLTQSATDLGNGTGQDASGNSSGAVEIPDPEGTDSSQKDPVENGLSDPSSNTASSSGSSSVTPAIGDEPEVTEQTTELQSDWVHSGIWGYTYDGGYLGFPLEIRIERDGDKVRGIIERVRNFPYGSKVLTLEEFNEIADYFSNPEDPLRGALFFSGMARPGRVLFEGILNGNRISGRERLNIAMPGYDDEFLCHHELDSELDHSTESWAVFEGSVDDEGIKIPIVAKVIEYDVDPTTGFAKNCRLNVTEQKIYTALFFQTPQVEQIILVEADPPYKPVDVAEVGQKLRLKILINEEAPGHEVGATVNSNEHPISLTATCGSDLISDPKICLTPVFVLSLED
ncbi:hypothetical protein MWU63_18995 [Pseudohalocynthiibacter sp. F2068]|jgi:hypothetical protein|nr:hypothetical protein [Pseudohalocynthiibacter sp. F2068]